MKPNLALFILALAIALLVSCSSSGSNPIAPNGDQIGNATSTSQSPSNRVLWGYWTVSIDPVSGQAEAVQLRTASLTANVNNLLESKPGNLQIGNIDTTNYLTDGRINCTVTLKHPFPGLDQYDGFDVWGVFMHNGATPVGYDGLKYPGGPGAGTDEASLLNPDGYTRWYNQPEFDGTGSPLFEFTPGKLSDLPTPTATLNAYKAFADNLGVEENYYQWMTTGTNAQNRGIFRAGAVNSRRYQLKFPIIGGAPKLSFQYAVIASWEVADPTKTGSPTAYDPGDFPSSANCEEAFLISTETSESDMYFTVDNELGGNFKARLEVFDWQGGSVGKTGVPNEINRVIINADFLPSGTKEWSQVELATLASPGTENSSVFQIEVPNCTPVKSGPDNMWIIVEAAGMNGGSYGQGAPTKYPTSAKRAAFITGSVNISPNLAWPDVIYVDNANITGIEDGTHAHPFDTIQEGIDNNPDNKEIWVDDSDMAYTENVQMKNDIILRSVNWDISDGGNKALIDPPKTAPSHSVTFATISNATISGFKIAPSGPIGTTGIGTVQCEFIRLDGGSGNIIKDCLFTGLTTMRYVTAIKVVSSSNLTVQNCRMDTIDIDGTTNYQMSYFYGLNAATSPNLSILNNIVTNIRPTSENYMANTYPFALDSCNDAVIKNNLIHHLKPLAPDNSNFLEGFRLLNLSNPTLINNQADSIDVTTGFSIQQVFIYRFENCTGTVTFKNNIATSVYCNGWPSPLARGMLVVGTTLTPEYCDMWDIGPGSMGQNYYGTTPGIGCISLDPPYVDKTSEQYDITPTGPAQQGYPSIVDWDDTGSPSGNPSDTNTNTRSRMGCFGGPGGEFVGLLNP